MEPRFEEDFLPVAVALLEEVSEGGKDNLLAMMVFNQGATAAALIALCQRMDNMTAPLNEGDALRVFDPERGE